MQPEHRGLPLRRVERGYRLKETDDILAANGDLDILFVLDGSMGVASTSSIQSAGLEAR